MARKKNNFNHDQFIEEWEEMDARKTGGANIIFHQKFKAKSPAQQRAKKEIQENALSLMKGEAGTGKSIIAVAQALEDLQKGKVRQIILTRPMIEAGNKTMGHLPGTGAEKIKPYLLPLLDNLEIFLGKDQLAKLIEEEIIKFEPINFLRGRTFHDSFVIIDEAQNCDKGDMYLALTRIGENSKYVVTYDEKQIDINPKKSCISDLEDFKGRDKIGFYEFTHHDIVRSEMCAMIVQVYNEIRARENA